jgi:hypothetical protein
MFIEAMRPVWEKTVWTMPSHFTKNVAQAPDTAWGPTPTRNNRASETPDGEPRVFRSHKSPKPRFSGMRNPVFEGNRRHRSSRLLNNPGYRIVSTSLETIVSASMPSASA